MDRYIEIQGLNVHYQEVGEGAPIIIMHGWGCNTQTVASITATASRTNRVYSIDLPGFGQTPEPPAVWGVEEYTRLIEDFAKQTGLRRPSLLGHSFGGRIGILFSSRNDVDKLILVDAAGVKPHRKLSYYLKVYSFKTAKTFIRLIFPKEKAQRLIEDMRNKRGSADYNQASPRMKEILSKCVNEDLRHVLPQIKAPTLLIWGENDTATPIRDARLMERLIPDAGLVSFPHCGHYSFLDNPAQFAAVLTSFLTSK
ncbi:MAG: alpha/beta hydrolase [Bacteroidales bacterium]|nr:alpha/beta hydrolase [Bacteroidales bacterium]